jgi:hypothetical protein
MFITACIGVYGQDDPTLAKNNEPTGIEAAEPESPPDQKIEKAPLELAPVNSQSFIIIKRTATENKVGPQGEDLIIKKNRFYYLDEKGKKVKVRNRELKQKPKHS